MEKKNFVSMILGTFSGMAFALGMCMVLLPEWNATTPGIIIGALGLLGGLAALMIRRKMEGKSMIHLTLKNVLISIFGLVATFVFAIGMVMSMVWGMLVIGIVIGMIGILMLLSLIPMIKGFTE